MSSWTSLAHPGPVLQSLQKHTQGTWESLTEKKGEKVQHAGEPGEISMIKTYINQTGKGALSKHKSLIPDGTYADINTMRVKTEDRGAGKVY